MVVEVERIVTSYYMYVILWVDLFLNVDKGKCYFGSVAQKLI